MSAPQITAASILHPLVADHQRFGATLTFSISHRFSLVLVSQLYNEQYN